MQLLSTYDKGVVAFCIAPVLMIGIALTFLGAKTARGFAAMTSAACGAVAGAMLLPMMADVSIFIAAAIGAVVGFVVGMMIFRIMQAVLLGTLVAVIVAGSYYGMWIAPERAVPEVPVAKMVKDAKAPVAKNVSAGLYEIAEKEYRTLPAEKKQMLLLLTAAAGILTAIVAFIFPRASCVVASAMFGATLCLGSAALLWGLYGTAQSWRINPHFVLVSWAFLALFGVAVQCRIFSRRADSSSGKSRTAEPSSSFSYA